jgi:hypothetical protein
MSDATYQPEVYMADGGDELVVASGGKITNDGTQASNIADMTVTATLTGVDTDTDMTAAQAATIVTDLTAAATKINAIIAALEGVGVLASS